MARSTETVRLTLRAYDRDHPDRAMFPVTTPSLDDDAKAQIYRRFRLGVSAEVLARQYGRTRSSIYRLINEVRAERILGTQARADRPRELQRSGRGRRNPGADARAGRRQSAPAAQGTQGASALPGQPLRSAAAGPRAGDAPVPEDELLQASGARDPPEGRPQPGQDFRPGRDRAASGRGPGRQEPDHSVEPAAGRLDRQAARRPVEQLLRAGIRRQHVADPGRRKVRLLARQQVQHVRLVGDHEELRPDDPRGELSPRPIRHRPRRNVRGRRR